jgi:hypothetical protein
MKNFCCVLLFAIISMNARCQDTQMKPEDTEDWSRRPEIVIPGEGTKPPSDAIVLYGGPEDLDKWESQGEGGIQWEVGEFLTVKPHTGGIQTKQDFGNVQLHIEWRTPEKVEGNGQERGNSGVFLMGRYEIQVLDSYDNETYYNGQAGSIYKDHIPLVNACLPPGAWQKYDIIFEAPVFNKDGSLARPAFVTVIQNGVLIQNHVLIHGTTDFIGIHKYTVHAPRLPLALQDHNNPVSFRNIWIREL